MSSSLAREAVPFADLLSDSDGGEAAEQQPRWRGDPDYLRVRGELARADPLVSPRELAALRDSLAAVAAGDATLLQLGDCAESLLECTGPHVFAKVEALNVLADHVENRTRLPAVRVGRIGGQFAKPRSRPHEWHDGVQLPTFRGHLVNSERHTREARRHDPLRMLRAYEASERVHRWLGRARERLEPGHSETIRSESRDLEFGFSGFDRTAPGRAGPLGDGPWSSHEALIIDYEASLMRCDPRTGRPFLSSTHLPWIGERTRHPDGPHVRMLALADNPVGCKVGPTAVPEDVVRLCELLDPGRVPGRLTLIPRMGRDMVAKALPPIVAAVRRHGHPVVWLCDPMHGNTRRTANGVKTRYLADVIAEAKAFRGVLERERQHPGGLHLEVAAAPVTECVGGLIGADQVPGDRYTTLCDPRLNIDQAFELLEAYL